MVGPRLRSVVLNGTNEAIKRRNLRWPVDNILRLPEGTVGDSQRRERGMAGNQQVASLEIGTPTYGEEEPKKTIPEVKSLSLFLLRTIDDRLLKRANIRQRPLKREEEVEASPFYAERESHKKKRRRGGAKKTRPKGRGLQNGNFERVKRSVRKKRKMTSTCVLRRGQPKRSGGRGN